MLAPACDAFRPAATVDDVLRRTSPGSGRSWSGRRLRRGAAWLAGTIADSWRRIRAAASIDDISIDVYDRGARRRGPKVARLQLRRTGAPQAGGPDAWMVTARSDEAAAEEPAAPPGPVIELEAGVVAPDPDTAPSDMGDPPRDPR